MVENKPGKRRKMRKKQMGEGKDESQSDEDEEEEEVKDRVDTPPSRLHLDPRLAGKLSEQNCCRKMSKMLLK